MYTFKDKERLLATQKYSNITQTCPYIKEFCIITKLFHIIEFMFLQIQHYTFVIGTLLSLYICAIYIYNVIKYLARQVIYYQSTNLARIDTMKHMGVGTYKSYFYFEPRPPAACTYETCII